MLRKNQVCIAADYNSVSHACCAAQTTAMMPMVAKKSAAKPARKDDAELGVVVADGAVGAAVVADVVEPDEVVLAEVVTTEVVIRDDVSLVRVS